MTKTQDVWHDARLGFRDIGHSFGNLVRSFDKAKVIAIEGGLWTRQELFLRTLGQAATG